MNEIVFLHGINNTGRAFEGVKVHLPAGLPVHAPDLPALPDVDRIAQVLLDDLPKRFVIAGHSFGGYVALAILALAGHRVTGIALINSSASPDSPEMAARRLELAARAEAGDYAELAAGATALTFHADALRRPDLMAERQREVEAYGADRYAAHQRACATRPDRGEALARYDGPKLVIAAREDAVIRCADQQDMAHRTNADFRVVENAGHMLPAENPQLVAECIAGWLAGGDI
ncbi:MAG: alpha/beta fold hydrolase [Pararhodobacter sp.]|nr:alpha/beta fold hydrolase [Pararhodobacter sp.]